MKKQNRPLYVLLPLIALVCVWLWSWAAPSNVPLASTTGTWDLRGADFSAHSYDLSGDVAYIPSALLTPQAFAARAEEAELGDPQHIPAACTSRIRILVPPGTYGLMTYSSEYADRLYINGLWAEDVGVPGLSAGASTPGTRLLYYTVEAPDGIIEIVQQASNYVYQPDGSHADIVIGTPEAVRGQYARQVGLAAVVMGCFLALALGHCVLYFLLRSYRANLWCALFCLVWFLRTGLTGPKLLGLLLPLPWVAAFRIEYLTVPAGLLLTALCLRALFPGALQRWFCAALGVVCGACALACVFLPTVSLSGWAMPAFYVVIGLSVAYVVVRLCVTARRPNTEQKIVLVGLSVFLAAAAWDILYYVGLLPGARTVASVALLVFVFFQMAAMFHGTMRQVAAARAAEQRLTLENAALDRVNRLKDEMVQNLTHELRTPLAVMSAYAQLAMKDLRQEQFSGQTTEDLQVIVDEAGRLAELASGALDVFSATRPTGDGAAVDMKALLAQVGRMCAPMLQRSGNRLEIDLPEQLPRVAGRTDELTQVVLNLLANAGAHTENGVVCIRARAEEEPPAEGGAAPAQMVAVTIADTGGGIAPGLLPHVFERGVTDRRGGAGLGLPICRAVVQAHGGSIAIQSEPGGGTAVRFTLPAAKEESDG